MRDWVLFVINFNLLRINILETTCFVSVWTFLNSANINLFSVQLSNLSFAGDIFSTRQKLCRLRRTFVLILLLVPPFISFSIHSSDLVEVILGGFLYVDDLFLLRLKRNVSIRKLFEVLFLGLLRSCNQFFAIS